MNRSILILLLVLTSTLFLAACSGQPLSTREKGTMFGGVLGAGTGAIIGSAVGAPGAGAAIGGALGAGTGFVVGNALQNSEYAIRRNRSELSSQKREIARQRSEIESLRAETETE